jgi:AbrB family transcriptional regulator (stage V sporulation protein T)
MKIREGEELEVFTADDNSLVLKKYSAVKELDTLAKEYVNAVYRTTGYTTVITDTDKIVAVSGDIKLFKMGDMLSVKGEKFLNERKPKLLTGQDVISFFNENPKEIKAVAAAPIVKQGDFMGALLVFSLKELGETALKTAETGASFFAAQI